MANDPARCFEFGPFRLEPDGLLVRDGKSISLPPKESELLRVLAEAEGRLVSKREIFERLWPCDDVGEASITRCVRGLRRAIEERGRNGGTIETLHGRGYRLAVPVHARRTPIARRSEDVTRIAVAPFDDFSANRANAHLGEGLAGEVAGILAQHRPDRIIVIARQSAWPAGRGRADSVASARALRLDFMVTGWLRLERDALHLQVEVIRTQDDVLTWCEEFKTPRGLIDGIAAEVAARIAAQLGSAQAEPPPSRTGSSAAARSKSYLALLQGQYAGQLRSEKGLRRAIVLFERALGWDAGNAEAYAALADAHLFLGIRGYAAPLSVAPSIRQALARALELRGQLVPGLCALAYLRWAIDFDPVAAMSAIESASARAPGNARVEWLRSSVLLSQRRFEAALSAIRESIEIDPFSPSTTSLLSFVLFCAGRYEECLVAARALAEDQPEFGLGHAIRSLVAAALGNRAEAIRAAELAETLAHGDQLTLSTCLWALASAGRTAHAESIRAALERKATRRYVAPSYLAIAAIALGDTEGALARLEQGLAERCMFLPYVGVDPRFAPLHSHARFRAVADAATGRRPRARGRGAATRSSPA